MYHGIIILQAAWRDARRRAGMARCSEATKGGGYSETGYKI